MELPVHNPIWSKRTARRSVLWERAISFIVPAHNEEAELAGTLRAIQTAMSFAGGAYEIIVVDDSSTDRTASIARVHGARVVSIHQRHIAAARNAGAQAASGGILVFVDADTKICAEHITGLRAALANGAVGGGTRLSTDRNIPLWGAIFFRLFSAVYFGLSFGAGAFLFTTRENFDAVKGFDEQYFAGEEVHFTLGLRRLGRFEVLPYPALTSGRKLRLYSGAQVLRQFAWLFFGGRRAIMSRKGLDLWYGEAREVNSV